MPQSTWASWRGSSPLTRGKLTGICVPFGLVGLIPAHAGKTTLSLSQPPQERAHPRSRGENMRSPASGTIGPGSSPLTRGKLILDSVPRGHGGLIPAHAGKTVFLRPRAG